MIVAERCLAVIIRITRVGPVITLVWKWGDVYGKLTGAQVSVTDISS